MLAILDGGALHRAMDWGAQGAFEMPFITPTPSAVWTPHLLLSDQFLKLADMAMEVELARNLLYKACWLRENSRPFGKEAAMAKLYCSEVMGRCVNHAVQLHGGTGS